MTDMKSPEGLTLRNNTQAQRFEAQAGDSTAVAEYSLEDNVITFTHTEVPKAMEGHGVAGQLIRTALNESRAQHYQVIPLCPFVAGYIRRHAEYQDLVPADSKHLIAEVQA